jgi:branched-chain amino acid transport system ATP-binding protein
MVTDYSAAVPFLRMQGVNAFYGESHILHGVDLVVNQGELVTLLGRNGAGRTTTIKSVLGLVGQRSGSIEILGQETIGWDTHHIARLGVGYCPEERGVFSSLSCEENLLLPPVIAPGAMTLDEIYSIFPNLYERRNSPGTRLSGVEQQMAAVARALSGNVRLLLLDEPCEGLAPTVVQELFTVFDQLRGKVSIVIVEHNLDLVLALADRVFALERGAVFHQGPAEPLLNDLDYRKKILWL